RRVDDRVAAPSPRPQPQRDVRAARQRRRCVDAGLAPRNAARERGRRRAQRQDRFNSSPPKNDGANIADYVTHPALPKLIEILHGARGAVAPTKIRTDLVATFAQGLEVTLTNNSKLKFTQNTTTGVYEYTRLNTSPDLGGATDRATQIAKANGLGALLCF